MQLPDKEGLVSGPEVVSRTAVILFILFAVGEEGEGQKQIPPNLFLSACHEKYNAANERHRAHDGRQRNIVSLLASSMNRSDVDDLFSSRIRKIGRASCREG